MEYRKHTKKRKGELNSVGGYMQTTPTQVTHHTGNDGSNEMWFRQHGLGCQHILGCAWQLFIHALDRRPHGGIDIYGDKRIH
jgi:hypothetical protein